MVSSSGQLLLLQRRVGLKPTWVCFFFMPFLVHFKLLSASLSRLKLRGQVSNKRIPSLPFSLSLWWRPPLGSVHVTEEFSWHAWVWGYNDPPHHPHHPNTAALPPIQMSLAERLGVVKGHQSSVGKKAPHAWESSTQGSPGRLSWHANNLIADGSAGRGLMG